MIYTIEDIAEIIDGDRGKQYPQQHEFFDSGYCLFLNTSNVTPNGFAFQSNQFITKQKSDSLRKGKLSRGDIVYTTRGTVGNAAFYSDSIPYENIRINSGMVILRPNPEIVDARFLYQILKSEYYRSYFKQFSTGSAQPQLPIKNLGKIELDIPSMDTQHRIADILSAYDDLIENNRQQIKLLEEAAQRLYQEWFVDLRFPGWESTEILGGLPKGWKYGSIQEISVCFDSDRIPLSSRERGKQQKRYPYYGAASLMDYVEDYIFDGVYLLLGEDGSVITTNGSPVLQYVWGKLWVNNHAHVFQGKPPFSTEFVYMTALHMKVSDIVTGAAQPKISQGRLNSKMIIIPDNDLAEKYSQWCKDIFSKIRLLGDEIKILSEARDRLLPKLMNGE